MRQYCDVIPETLALKVVAVWGDEGRNWLDSFDQTLEAICRQWNLSDIVAFPNLSYNFVSAARRQGTEPVVLKMAVRPDDLDCETSCLKAFDGQGAVRLLAHNFEFGALLLERLRPGEALWTVWSEETDDKQTEIAARCMKQIWRPTQIPFPTTADWFKAIPAYRNRYPVNGPLPANLVERAEAMVVELESSNRERFLLHGDLHHGNILSGWNEWKVIDPKGVIGDPAFEAAAWLRNPCDRILQVHNLSEVLHRRLQIIADITDLDPQKLKAWSFCGCVLSACWSTESKDENWDESIACAEMLL
jgi:streptomycin 6-kinase